MFSYIKTFLLKCKPSSSNPTQLVMFIILILNLRSLYVAVKNQSNKNQIPEAEANDINSEPKRPNDGNDGNGGILSRLRGGNGLELVGNFNATMNTPRRLMDAIRYGQRCLPPFVSGFLTSVFVLDDSTNSTTLVISYNTTIPTKLPTRVFDLSLWVALGKGIHNVFRGFNQNLLGFFLPTSHAIIGSHIITVWWSAIMLAGSMAGYFLLPDYGYFGHLAGVAADHLKKAWREVQRNKTIDVPYTTDEVPELPGYSQAVSDSSTSILTMPENSPSTSDWTPSEASDWTTTSEIASPDSVSASAKDSPITSSSSPETISSSQDWNDNTRARGRAQLREQQIRIRNDM